MLKCEVYADGEATKYEGQYEIIDNSLIVEIFGYHSIGDGPITFGSDIIYKGIELLDLSNKRYFYSPLFFNCGTHYGLYQSESYKSSLFFETGNHEAVESFSEDMKFSQITVYNAALCHCQNNSALEIQTSKDDVTYKINRTPQGRIVSIGVNNIDKIELNTRCTWLHKDNNYSVHIDTENYATLYLTDAVDYQELIAYTNEIDVMICSYTLIPVHSYEIQVKTTDDVCFKLIHKLVSGEKRIEWLKHKPIKKCFEEYLEAAYKKINYRNTDSRNEFILLDFKRPSSLEDEYTFYFRFIDLYMGKKLARENKNNSNYARLSEFVDKFVTYFKVGEDYTDIDTFKNELNSLRNHFVHEGYYFPENHFAVKGRKQEFLYYKDIDYSWLYSIVKTFKFCSYLIMYKEIMETDIDENELKYALN